MKISVFFDWDGTLVDSLGMLSSAHNYVRGQLGYPLWSKEEYAAAMINSTRELYPKLYGDRAQEAQDMLYGFIKEKHLDYLKVMPGALELLEMLQEMNIPMAVISNKRNDVLVREVEALGWEKFFPIYLGAGVAVTDKPSAAPILYAQERHPARPDLKYMIYVGDTEADLKASSAAGCLAALVLHDGPKPELVGIYDPAIVSIDLFQLRQKIMEYIQA